MELLDIFIVDDDKDFAESMAMVLEGRGYEVDIAHSGEDAIAKFKERDFDVAFMDVKLPGMNGVESFMEIRKFKPDTKIVMMTGYSVEQLLDQAVENGAWGVLHKPLDMGKVIETIENLGGHGILIADDNPEFVESINELLTNKGYKVFKANNGKEAIECIESNGIDILILDLRMPVLDGLGTYMELKKTGKAVPTIIVTAFADKETKAIETLRSLSVSGILRKPFDPNELISALDKLKAEADREEALKK
jgi:CheY-like chemotaxis protein